MGFDYTGSVRLCLVLKPKSLAGSWEGMMDIKQQVSTKADFASYPCLRDI